ncbi:MaoC/PaaZ C-terminal domain-containing protein [Nocardia nepalensis]|uniref:MaoC/PaaZ C-terminal domain-containing protein n=1 Tax=Nocardia nepalensis TaxID=3375448 RepID=UPI003B66FAAC
MSESTYKFNADAIGKWTPETRFEVEQDRLIAYAEATNDPIEEHRAGAIAAPVFAVVPIFDSLVGASLEVAPYQLIPRLVHGEQYFRYHRHIRPGDTLVSRAKPIGYQGLPNGTRGTVYAETRDSSGELLNEQWVTFFFRKYDCGETVGDLGPKHGFDGPLAGYDPVMKLSQHIDADQTFRYAPAAGDPMPIHLDVDSAKAAGLPGIIAHGLCTMAFTSWAALTELADSRTERLRELAVRFAKPVLPDQDIESAFWHSTSQDGASSYVFQTTALGDLVIKDGLVVIDD